MREQTLKASISPNVHSDIEQFLKALRKAARRLNSVVAAHALEKQLLCRVHYKGNNQHRNTLFWKHVEHAKRVAARVADENGSRSIDSLRNKFFPDAKTAENWQVGICLLLVVAYFATIRNVVAWSQMPQSQFLLRSLNRLRIRSLLHSRVRIACCSNELY